VDLGRAVRRALQEGMLLKGGGHAMAAGVTLKKDALGAFRAFLEDTLAEPVELARRDSALLIDGAVTAGGFNFPLADLMARAGPFGAGNPEPVLALPSHTLVYADPIGDNHIRARFRSGDGKFVNAIAFRAMGQPLGKALMDNRGRALHAAGQIAVDRWQGEERVQLRLTDLAAS
jgi:single-stranded-DNA-specific exonuclease